MKMSGALGGVIALMLALAGCGSSSLVGTSAVEGLLAGAPQGRMTLGDPEAPVELIEFADLQCPVCRVYAEKFLPPVIEGPVAAGEAKLVFRNFTVIGPESVTAGAAALAAGEQGRGWNFVEIFLRNQGPEAAGYVTDEFLTEVAKAAGVGDIGLWNEERKDPALAQEVRKTTQEAVKLGATGAPSFAIQGPKSSELEVLGAPGSSSALLRAVSRVN
jgi:protein-disulfide isomerase